MPVDAYFDEDWNTSQAVDEIWESNHWELAVKLIGDPQISSLVEIIRNKIYQARFDLKNILNYSSKVPSLQMDETDSREISTVIIQYELDFLFFTLYRIMDLLAVLITIIYGIKITRPEIRFRDFFPQATGLINSGSFLIFNELKRKDSILAEQLSSFYFSAENKLLSGILQKNGFSDPSFFKYAGYSLNYKDIVLPGKNHSKSETYVLSIDSVARLEKAYREAACKFGRLIFNHLNYEPILIHYFSGYQTVE